MHPRTPVAWREVTATPAHRDERAALRKRLRLHELERLRLHTPRTRLAAYEDRRLLEYGPPMKERPEFERERPKEQGARRKEQRAAAAAEHAESSRSDSSTRGRSLLVWPIE